MELIIILICIYVMYRLKIIQFIWFLLTKPSSNPNNFPVNPKKFIDTSTLFKWPSNGNFDFEVVGESFYQPAIKSIASTQKDREQTEFNAVLTLDDYNKYDNKAVKVEINGLQVGHLSKADARSFRRRLATKKLTNQTTTAKAIIIGGHEDKKGNKMHYGVMLDMKPFNN